MKLNPYLLPSAQINLKWIKDLNVRPETVRLLKENIGKKPLDHGLGPESFSSKEISVSPYLPWVLPKLI